LSIKSESPVLGEFTVGVVVVGAADVTPPIEGVGVNEGVGANEGIVVNEGVVASLILYINM